MTVLSAASRKTLSESMIKSHAARKAAKLNGNGAAHLPTAKNAAKKTAKKAKKKGPTKKAMQERAALARAALAAKRATAAKTTIVPRKPAEPKTTINTELALELARLFNKII